MQPSERARGCKRNLKAKRRARMRRKVSLSDQERLTKDFPKFNPAVPFVMLCNLKCKLILTLVEFAIERCCSFHKIPQEAVEPKYTVLIIQAVQTEETHAPNASLEVTLWKSCVISCQLTLTTKYHSSLFTVQKTAVQME